MSYRFFSLHHDLEVRGYSKNIFNITLCNTQEKELGFIVLGRGEQINIRIFFSHTELVFVLNNVSLYSASTVEYCYNGEAIVMSYRRRR